MIPTSHLQTIAARIVDALAAGAAEARVTDVRIGLGYSAVELEDGRLGVAYTFRDLARGGCSVFHGLRPLAPRRAADLLPLLCSSDAIEAGVGLACANALTGREAPGDLEGDVLDHLEIRPTDEVAMIGHFRPLVAELRARARSLAIFERAPEPSEAVRPAAEAPEALARCQVALITATSIINGTLDGLLEAARGCREVALLGPSTPRVPAAFLGTPVTALFGAVAIEPAAVLRVVSEGGGMRQFSRHLRKVCTRLQG
jgi:hypothetical protein